MSILLGVCDLITPGRSRSGGYFFQSYSFESSYLCTHPCRRILGLHCAAIVDDRLFAMPRAIFATLAKLRSPGDVLWLPVTGPGAEYRCRLPHSRNR